MLQNGPSVDKFHFDAAENELSELKHFDNSGDSAMNKVRPSP